MPSWIADAYNAVNTFAAANPALYPIVLAAVLPLFGWLRQKGWLLARADRRRKLEQELDQLKKYQDEDKLPHLAGVLESFLGVTLTIALGEVSLYYLTLLFTSLLSADIAPVDTFAYFYLLTIYGYLVLLILKRLRRIMNPQRYIGSLERRLATLANR